MTIKDIDNFSDEVMKVIKNWFQTSGFKARKLTDTPTDSLQVVNKNYVDTLPVTNGVFTKNMADASAVQTITHGLGRIPRFIRMTALFFDGTELLSSIGTYNGSTIATTYTYPAVDAATSTTNIIRLIPATGNIQAAVPTFDSTNITLTWTKTLSPTGSASTAG